LDYDFRIAGENPTKAAAEAFLTGTYGGKSASQALTTNPHAWFAWAIAKDETAGEGSGGYYNHFLANGGDPLTSKGTPSDKSQPWPGHEGRPNWNDDGTYQDWNKTHTKRVGRWTGSGGYGLFQLTYASRNTAGNTADANYIMPRGWIWNWQANALAFNTEFQTKVTAGTNLYNLLLTSYPNNGAIPSAPGGNLSGLDAIIVTEYNGMSGGSHPNPGQIASWKTKSNWVLLNGTLQPSCWVPLRGGWQFLQNGEYYEQNVNAILNKH